MQIRSIAVISAREGATLCSSCAKIATIKMWWLFWILSVIYGFRAVWSSICLLQIVQTIRCDQILPVADDQDPLTAIFHGQLREVGHASRQVYHADVEMAGQEGNHAVGEGIPRRKEKKS